MFKWNLNFDLALKPCTALSIELLEQYCLASNSKYTVYGINAHQLTNKATNAHFFIDQQTSQYVYCMHSTL